MAEIRNCTCGAEPVKVKCRGRWIIACPNKKCSRNICSYPDQDIAVRNWNEEVERFGSTGKGN